MTDMCKSDDTKSIQIALDIIGDKYSAILIKLMHEAPQRFKDFERKVPGISPRTLSQRLSMLEDHGIIEKNTCPESPGRCHYELSPAGLDLDDVIHCMARWGKQHATPTPSN